jgi:PKD repeat protein
MGMRKKHLFYVIVMTMIMLSTSSVILQVAAAPDPPKYIHLTWNTADMAHTIVVTWSTIGSGSGNSVLYDTISRAGEPLQYQYSATGSFHTYSGSTLYVHDVVLTGLSTDTTYYFICGGSTGGYSNERVFHTAPTISEPITFVAGGDSHASQTNKVQREQVSRTMATFNPSFVVQTGDYCDSDTSSNWPLWLADVENNWIGSNGLTIPLIGAVGNHEGSANTFHGQFSFPGNELWYSLNWGPDLHIVVLDSEYDVSGNQLTWLKQDLAANQYVKWKVVLFHQPPYSSGWHGSNTGIRNAWCSVFDQYGVDLVFNGHDHDYERSKPIYNNAVVINPDDGTTYVVGGGWGGSLRSVGSNWWTAYSRSVYHFTVVQVNGDVLSLNAYDQYGTIFDSVQWQKNAQPNTPPTAAFTYSPATPNTADTVQFTDQSTDSDGTITSWSWSFGDGSTSTGQNPTHRYPTAGTYTVTLTVTDNRGGTGTYSQNIAVSQGLTYSLTISVNPSGAGTTNPSAGTYTYAAGTQVTITATAASGYVFDSWSGGASGTSPTISVTMNSNKNIIANFKTSTNLALKKPATADSSQWGRSPAYGNDGNTATRWCAANGNLNHWWKVDLGAIYSLTGTEVMWEFARNYKYKVEVSTDNISWTLVVDKTKNTSSAQTQKDNFTATARYIRITVTGLPSFTWASFYEFRVFGN